MTASNPPISGAEEFADTQAAPGGPTRVEAGSRPAANAADHPDAWADSGGDRLAGPQGQLLDPVDAAALARRWDDIQAGFVDEPRQAVSDADALVTDLIQRLTRMFADEHTRLEAGMDRDGQDSTEDLRVGLRRYRDFFDRLLAA